MELTPDQHVSFDEFSRACDLVEHYFGDLVDGVALHAPVSRRQLVAILARAQLFGQALADELTEQGTVVYDSANETALWLEGTFWNTFGVRQHLTPDETRAAREVHRRVIETIDGDVPYYNRERDPFVLIDQYYS